MGRPRKDEIVVTDEIQYQQSCVSTVIHQRPHKTLQIHDLTKRTSDTSVFYDTYVGPSLDKFPSSKLPHKRVVLQRYRYLLASDTKYTRNDIIGILTKEVIYLWELSSIPTKEYRRCWDVVQKCIGQWIDAKNDVRKSSAFQLQLDTLLDL